MRRNCVLCLLSSLVFAILSVSSVNITAGTEVSTGTISVIVSDGAGGLEELAAKEVRRYLYLRTGQLVELQQGRSLHPGMHRAIVVTRKDRPLARSLTQGDEALSQNIKTLGAQEYLLKALPDREVFLIVGGDSAGTLYGVYRFVEHLGVRFYLHGDVVPDDHIEASLPVLEERGSPLFETRGIQPFHDFPEGPDWWNVDDYKAVLAQLPKLRMNFFGLHTYPEGGVGPEPTVWIGTANDVNPDGTVRFSSQSSYQNTLRGNWGYAAKKTSDFSFGSDQLFEQDGYGPEVMSGAIPWSQTPDERNAVFNRTGQMLREAFEFAHFLGTKTCVGTETPLIIPKIVKERLKSNGLDPNDPAVVRQVYEGMFHRIKKMYPLDYYWFWTPESWTWGGVKDTEIEATVADLKAAIDAVKNVDAPFTLATCGWVLGPPMDRALFDNILPKSMPMSCINRNVGFVPVEPGFAQIEGRPQWAIPWLEDDPALLIPQLWVGRMRRDAADALAYGCTGLLGIHWRTRVLAPNVSALARAAWEQKPWNPHPGDPIVPPPPKKTEGRTGGNTVNYANNAIADTECDPLYQTVAYGMGAYRVKVPNGTYTVRLQFCEPHYSEVGKRVFGVALQDKKVIDKLDIFATVGQNRALDYTFEGIKGDDGFLEIRFDSIVEFPCIAAFVVEGQDTVRRINCGGGGYGDYEADIFDVGVETGPRDLPADDFYADWARTQFGPEVAQPMAVMFTKLDGGPNVGMQGQRIANLPRPSTWVQGPGGIVPDGRPWDQVRDQYAFVNEMTALRPQVKGPGCLERFDYWLNTFRYLRAIGHVNCTWARFNSAMDRVKKEQDSAQQKQLARTIVLPIRKELIAQVAEVHESMLATITTTGGMGTMANWQQHLLPSLLTEPGKELAALLGEDLPADAMPSNIYNGPTRLMVPTVRTLLVPDEDLKLKVIILGSKPSDKLSLSWRPMGKGDFTSVPLKHVARGVYTVTIPAGQFEGKDFEYYIQATTADGEKLVFPATAPRINQTVVVHGTGRRVGDRRLVSTH